MGILCVTANPAVDRVGVVPVLQPGTIHRPQALRVSAGGKGVNVARVVVQLGEEAVASVLLAGYSGRWMAQAMRQDGIVCLASWTNGETRSCLSILDETTGGLTEFYESGIDVSRSAWERFETQTVEAIRAAGAVTLSGSLPNGAPEAAYAEFVAAAHEVPVPCLVDTTGPPLDRALVNRPHLVKLNGAEASSWAGWSVSSPDTAFSAAEKLVEAGARAALVSLGRAGAVLVTGRGEGYLGHAPEVATRASVGSGDAMLAGLALNAARGGSWAEGLRWGLASGAANAEHLGAGQVDRERVEMLYREIELVRRQA